MKSLTVVLTCEHAVNDIPAVYANYFSNKKALLNTHRGIDFGALFIANTLTQTLKCPFYQAKVSRLLIDCNRSLNKKGCWSEISQQLSEQEKIDVIENYYLPYRQAATECMDQLITSNNRVLHISVHSFTPILNNIPRTTDIGLLYDPKRANEKQFALAWAYQFKQKNNSLRVRFNYPYKGIGDGFTTSLRKQFTNENYLGIELESNQFLTLNSDSLISLTNTIQSTLIHTLSLFK